MKSRTRSFKQWNHERRKTGLAHLRRVLTIAVVAVVALLVAVYAYQYSPYTAAGGAGGSTTQLTSSSSVTVSAISTLSTSSSIIGGPSKTPIDHIVIILQEDHSFDNLFGTFPGLDASYAVNTTTCEPNNTSDPSKGCTKPFNADNISSSFQSVMLANSWTAAHAAYNNGSLNGFVYAQALAKKTTHTNYTLGYFTGKTIPNYWDYASYYGLDANFFTTPSLPVTQITSLRWRGKQAPVAKRYAINCTT